MPRSPTRHPLAFLVAFATSVVVASISARDVSHLDPTRQSSSTQPMDAMHALSDSRICRRTGRIQDARCDFASLDFMNPGLLEQLDRLVELPIFRYHKVDLRRKCPYWEDDGMCGNRACAVLELEGEDVPPHFKPSALSALTQSSILDAKDVPIALDDGCVVTASDFCVREDDRSSNSQGSYVDLVANPERFTGYAGPSAARVWSAIYEENCFGIIPRTPSLAWTFTDSPGTPFRGLAPSLEWDSDRKGGPVSKSVDLNQETCLEKRVYYRVLSGLHTSISMHICAEHLNTATGRWGPSLDCFKSRVGLHPDRIENLYFAYALMLRSLAKVGPALVGSPEHPGPIELCTGDEQVDIKTRNALEELVKAATTRSERNDATFFDEQQLFNGQGSLELKDEFKDKFRNVSRMMDCIGCERCRLWGKIQVMGIGTALKLLFEYKAVESGAPPPGLTRAELVSFVNTLHRISESIGHVVMFQHMWEDEEDRVRAQQQASTVRHHHLARPASGNGDVSSSRKHSSSSSSSQSSRSTSPGQRPASRSRSRSRTVPELMMPSKKSTPTGGTAGCGARCKMVYESLWKRCRQSWIACFDWVDRLGLGEGVKSVWSSNPTRSYPQGEL